MVSPLADLDELVLKCRNEQAKSYLREAVVCYKSGALRSAIVSTWIAVFFDIFEKFKELSGAGDNEASKQVENYEQAIERGDIAKALRFEKELLSLARDKFNLISHMEALDLERIKDDRHRCAHPSVNGSGEIFSPSAELVRSHIRSAVEHLLQYPPAQGRYALEKVLSEINSAYFPSDKKKILTALSKTPLARPRDSLIRSVIVVLCKDLLKIDEHKEVVKKAGVLGALAEIHRGVFESTLKEKLSVLFREVSDDDLVRCVLFLFHVPGGLWEFLDEGVQLRLSGFVENLPRGEILYLEEIKDIPQLAEAYSHRVGNLARADFVEMVFVGPLPREISNKLVELYSGSESVRQASMLAPVVAEYAADFSQAQIMRIARALSTNSHVYRSKYREKVISSLRGQVENMESFDRALGRQGS